MAAALSSFLENESAETIRLRALDLLRGEVDVAAPQSFTPAGELAATGFTVNEMAHELNARPSPQGGNPRRAHASGLASAVRSAKPGADVKVLLTSSLEGESAEAVRLRALDALLSEVDADAAFFQSFTLAGGVHVPRAQCWRAHGDTGDAIQNSINLQLQNPEACTVTLDLRTPSFVQRTSFVEDQALWDPELFEQTAFYQRIFSPVGIRYQMRLLAYHGERFVGWIGLVRTRGTRPFVARERKRLTPLVKPVITALTSAERFEQQALPKEPADLIVHPDGRVEYASESGRFWLARDPFRAALANAVRRLDRGEEQPTSSVLDLAQTKLLRLEGENGRVRYLAHVVPAPPVTLSPLADLTPKQRIVAELAATGFTIGEVAHELNVRPYTVREHLKEVYRRLNVANRVELARFIEPDAA